MTTANTQPPAPTRSRPTAPARMFPLPDKIERKYIGTRVGFTLVATASFFGTVAALAHYPSLSQPETWNALEWLLGVLGAAILGDTARPSGLKKGAFGVAKQ